MTDTPTFEDVIAAQTQEIATHMADVFFENSEWNEDTGERLASDEGLEKMAEMFGAVEPFYRGEVFIELIAELERRDIKFDVKQFQTETVH